MKRLLLALTLTLLPAAAAADTVIAARTIRAQTILTAADVVVVEEDVPGGYISLDEVIGQEARVAIFANRPIMLAELGPPAVIDRNQVVLLIYRAGTLAITADGRSLARAGVGEMVRVMNLNSKQTITGLVMADGTVSVSPGSATFTAQERTQ